MPAPNSLFSHGTVGAYGTVVSGDAPAGWWKLGDTTGSSIAADSSGSGYDMAASNVTFGTSGPPLYMSGTCAGFNGTSSNATETAWNGPASSPFSVEIWVNNDGQTEDNSATYIAQGIFATHNRGWVLQNSFGSVQFGIANGTTFQTIDAGSTGSTGWAHLVGTYDGTTMTLYVSGSSVGTATLAGPMVPDASTPGIKLGDTFAGLLTQAAVYDTCLTETQVLAHFSAAMGAQSSLAFDPNTYTMGMQFTLASDAALTGIWFYSAPGAGALPDFCCIYDVGSQTVVSSTDNASPSWSGAAGSGWVKCTYDGSVTLIAATNYKVCVYTNAGGSIDWYTATRHFWDTGTGSAGLTNGIISAPNYSNADGGNQDSFVSFNNGYPNTSFLSTNYWIDVEVTISGGGSGSPTGLLPAFFL